MIIAVAVAVVMLTIKVMSSSLKIVHLVAFGMQTTFLGW